MGVSLGHSHPTVKREALFSPTKIEQQKALRKSGPLSVDHTCNPSLWDNERITPIQDQPGLCSEIFSEN